MNKETFVKTLTFLSGAIPAILLLVFDGDNFIKTFFLLLAIGANYAIVTFLAQQKYEKGYMTFFFMAIPLVFLGSVIFIGALELDHSMLFSIAFLIYYLSLCYPADENKKHFKV